MRKTILAGMVATAGLVAGAYGHAAHADGDVAGEWTKCVAWSGGATFNIVNGYPNAPRCFDLGRKCTGNPNAKVTYYNPAVAVNAPYQRCTLN
jgi:hypothetical protein